MAVYLFTAHKKGISSHQLARDLNITQKSAWHVLHRIREAFTPDNHKLSGQVEIDETYVGGKEKNKHRSKKTSKTQGRSIKTKTPVIGILERNGKVYAIPVKDASSSTVKELVEGRVERGSKVYTDEWHSYRILDGGYERGVVRHGASQYVDGDIHTQNIENFWSHLKRGIIGIYHQVSDKHLDRYVNEFTFRYNNRTMTDGSRFDICLANAEKRKPYRELTGK